jgi:hypothetical protein
MLIPSRAAPSNAATGGGGGGNVTTAGLTENRITVGAATAAAIKDNAASIDISAAGYVTRTGFIGIAAQGGAYDLDLSAGADASLRAAADVRLDPGASGTVYFRPGGTPGLYFTVPSAGAQTIQHAAGATSVSYGQAQDGSAAGGTLQIGAQQGAAGFTGGTLATLVGAGGTPGTDLPGNADTYLRTPVANVTGRQRWLDASNPLAQLYQYAASSVVLRFGAGDATCATGVLSGRVEGAALTMWAHTGDLTNYTNANSYNSVGAAGVYYWVLREYSLGVRYDRVDYDGLNTTSWADSITQVHHVINAATSDKAAADFTWRAQDAYSAATTNVNGGDFEWRVGSPKAAGTGQHGEWIFAASDDDRRLLHFMDDQTWSWAPPEDGVFKFDALFLADTGATGIIGEVQKTYSVDVSGGELTELNAIETISGADAFSWTPTIAADTTDDEVDFTNHVTGEPDPAQEVATWIWITELRRTI